jgi:hypothetical protein
MIRIKYVNSTHDQIVLFKMKLSYILIFGRVYINIWKKLALFFKPKKRCSKGLQPQTTYITTRKYAYTDSHFEAL